jgi:hypothetical protein
MPKIIAKRHFSFSPAIFCFLSGASAPQSKMHRPPLNSVVFLLHQHFKQKKMKTKSIILAAVLTLTASMLFAGNDIVINRIANENTSVTLAAIAPVTPTEATFEEVSTVTIDFANLAPSLPLEADFSDAIPVTPAEASFEEISTVIIDLANLAPSLPLEADFSDAAPAENIDMTNLAPAAPAEADFNDSVEILVDINTLAPSTPFVAEFE